MESPRQVGALPVRQTKTGALEILLITSRDTRRWVIPKGWPRKRLGDPVAAAREARDEAGVTGRISSAPVGSYRYRKSDDGRVQIISVAVFVLTVDKEKKRWREQQQRQRAWFPIKIAARRVREPHLKRLIAGLDGVAPKSSSSASRWRPLQTVARAS
jgi:ADP-ribose pyrophosphatase YjhB (NUDIX family)